VLLCRFLYCVISVRVMLFRFLQGMPKKVISLETFSISGIVVNLFAKFTVLTEEDSGHIFCKFHYSIWLHSKKLQLLELKYMCIFKVNK